MTNYYIMYSLSADEIYAAPDSDPGDEDVITSAPKRPTDEDIVAAYESMQRGELAPTATGWLVVDGIALSMSEVREAWGRELKRRLR